MRVALATGLVLAGTALFTSLAMNADERDSRVGDIDAPTPIYEHRDDCDLPCFSTAASDTFVVPATLREIEFSVFANLDDATGPARISVVDPSGDLRYERLFTSEASTRATQDAATWTAEAGEWTIARSYVGVAGSISFDAWGIGASVG